MSRKTFPRRLLDPACPNAGHALETVVCLVFLVFFADMAWSASAMTVGQDEGYSGKVLDRIVKKWSPPQQLKGNLRMTLVISVDGSGDFLDCRVVKSSGLQALDVSACAAARKAAPFGAPPYGMPAELFFSFWNGGPDSRVQDDPARPGLNMAGIEAANARATAANENARAKASEAARKTGRELNIEGEAKKQAKVQTTPAKKTAGEDEKPAQAKKEDVKQAPPLAKASEDNQGASRGPGGASAEKALPAKKQAPVAPRHKDAPAIAETQSVGTAREATAKAPSPTSPKAASTGGAGVNQEKADLPLAQHKYAPQYAKYLSGVVWKLRNAMYVPVETPKGLYFATVQLKCDAAGKILSATFLEKSGDETLDRYIMQGLKRAGRISPPPAGLGDTLDLTFSFIRK